MHACTYQGPALPTPRVCAIRSAHKRLKQPWDICADCPGIVAVLANSAKPAPKPTPSVLKAYGFGWPEQSAPREVPRPVAVGEPVPAPARAREKAARPERRDAGGPRLPVAKVDARKPPDKPVPSKYYPARQHALAHAMWVCMRQGQVDENGRCLVRNILAAYNSVSVVYRIPHLEPMHLARLLIASTGIKGDLRRRYTVNGETGPAVKVTGYKLSVFIRTRIGIELGEG